jgi:myosin heavy subunit
MGEVLPQIEGLAIKLSQSEEALEPRVGPLERAETKDRTSRVESVAAGLRAAMADCRAKVEDVRREVAGLKAQLSDCCQKVNRDFTNLERELTMPKEEMRELRLLKVAMAEGRKVVGQLEDLRSKNDHERLAAVEVARANERLRAEAARLKQRIKMLEQQNRRLSEANKAVKRDAGEVSNCCRKVKKDLTNQERELAKLKAEIRTMRPQPEPFAPLVADGAVPPALKAAAPTWKPLSSSRPPNAASPPPKPAKQLPQSMNQGKTRQETCRARKWRLMRQQSYCTNEIERET